VAEAKTVTVAEEEKKERGGKRQGEENEYEESDIA
jgi:hypothetical protein